MDFEIKRADKLRAVYLIAGNLVFTLITLTLLSILSDTQSNIIFASLLFEGTSVLVVFLLFASASLISVSGAHMNSLLAGLFLYQIGALLDAMDEVIAFPHSGWSATGDFLRLAGEVTLAAVAFHFVRLTSKIADTDRLTELQNRSFHHRWIAQHLDRSRHPVAVIAIDLDAFKGVNDAHGHDFGDMVLGHIGKLLKQFVRAHRGIASRTGGEEFEIALRRSDESSALQIAEALRLLIEQNPPQGLERITASIGVAISQPDENVTTLRRRADAAAYLSKQSGRNRVSLAGQNQTISTVSPE